MTKHYIAMSGDHGCLPDHCEVYAKQSAARADIVDLFELGSTRAARFRGDNYIELTPDDGAQYAEVVDCTCPSPWEHSEMGKDEFIRERGDEFGLSDEE